MVLTPEELDSWFALFDNLWTRCVLWAEGSIDSKSDDPLDGNTRAAFVFDLAKATFLVLLDKLEHDGGPE